MKIHDLKQLEILSTAIFHTHNVGLDNHIESIMVLEALDIEQWGSENQILLSSYIAFKDCSQEELQLFFKKLVAIKISGLIIKTGRFINSIPDHFVHLCFVHQIPLIEVKNKILYEDIVVAIHQPLLNHDSYLLKLYFDSHKKFSNLNLGTSSYSDLLYTFSNMINLQCQLYSYENNLQIKTYNFPTSNFKSLTKNNIQTKFVKNNYTLEEVISLDTQETSWFLYITSKKSPKISIHIQLETDNISDTLLMITENFIDIMSIKIQNDALSKNKNFIDLNNIASSILFNHALNPSSYKRLLVEANLDQFSQYQLLTITHTLSNKQLDILKQELKKISSHFIYCENINFIYFIFNIPHPSHLDINYLKVLAKNYNNTFFYLSNCSSAENINMLYSQCTDMINFNNNFNLNNLVIYNELGVLKSLISLNTNEINDLIPEQLKKLYHEENVLFDTFVTFINCNKDYKETSNQLFVHPKTVRYRINKIQTILNFSIQDSMQFLNYTIGAILLELNS